MADLRTSFPGLEDAATGAGLAIHNAVEGEAVAGKNAAAAMIAKDDGGLFDYLNLDAAGNLLVSSDGGGTCQSGGTDGTPIAGNTAKTQVAEIALTVGKVHRKLEWSVANFRDTIYTIEVIDDPAGTPSIVKSHEVLVGSGSFTDNGELACFEFDTTGYTAPVLRIYGQNLSKESDFRATIAITEDNA